MADYLNFYDFLKLHDGGITEIWTKINLLSVKQNFAHLIRGPEAEKLSIFSTSSSSLSSVSTTGADLWLDIVSPNILR